MHALAQALGLLIHVLKHVQAVSLGSAAASRMVALLAGSLQPAWHGRALPHVYDMLLVWACDLDSVCNAEVQHTVLERFHHAIVMRPCWAAVAEQQCFCG